MKTRCRTLLCLGIASLVAIAAEGQVSRSGVFVWDTGKPSAAGLTPEALEKQEGWTRILRGEAPRRFTGDAILSNGRIAVLLRKRDHAAEIHSVDSGGTVSRVRLRLLDGGGEEAVLLSGVKVVDQTRSAARLEATYRTAGGAALAAKLLLKRGSISLQIEPGSATHRLTVECPSRYLVLPDFFADDILIDAAAIPSPSLEIPSENFLLHLTGNRDAVAMCVFENRDQEVRVSLSGDGAGRKFSTSEITFGKGGKIWVSLITGSGVWHARDVGAGDAGRIIPLEWKMPFAASWRGDFTTDRGLTDSWDMLLARKKGDGYVKPAWFGVPAESVNAQRKRFTEVLGFFPYPCWTDAGGRGHIQPLDLPTRTKFIPKQTFRGPMVVYPFNRTAETPIETYTVVDVARNCLGVGPCEYLLDVEGQKKELRGRATCTVQKALDDIYKNGRQIRRRLDIEKGLDDAVTFVKHIRSRIGAYADFGRKTADTLEKVKGSHPRLKKPLAELETLAREIGARIEYRKDRIKTPEDVVEMNRGFRRNVLAYEGPDALERCREYTKALTRIGGNQDKLVSECRWVVRTLRQRAGILMAVHPELAPIAGRIRAQSQKVLRNPSHHERARN